MKVLIVEDLEVFRSSWKRELEGKVTPIFAASIKEAEEKFSANPDIAAVVLDACVESDDDPDTLPLARKFRQTFAGPMIAVSSLEDYRRQLREAGCDHESPKRDMVQKLSEVLGLGL